MTTTTSNITHSASLMITVTQVGNELVVKTRDGTEFRFEVGFFTGSSFLWAMKYSTKFASLVEYLDPQGEVSRTLAKRIFSICLVTDLNS